MKRLVEYQCNDCEAIFERRVKDDRRDVVHCPNCGGDAHRRITAPAVHYHGDGFTKSVRGNK